MEVHSLIEPAIFGISKKFKIISRNFTMRDFLNAGQCNNITKFTQMEEADFFLIVTLRVLAHHVEQMEHAETNVILAEQRTNHQN